MVENIAEPGIERSIRALTGSIENLRRERTGLLLGNLSSARHVDAALNGAVAQLPQVTGILGPVISSDPVQPFPPSIEHVTAIEIGSQIEQRVEIQQIKFMSLAKRIWLDRRP